MSVYILHRLSVTSTPKAVSDSDLTHSLVGLLSTSAKSHASARGFHVFNKHQIFKLVSVSFSQNNPQILSRWLTTDKDRDLVTNPSLILSRSR